MDAVDPPVTVQDVQEILDGREVGTDATRPPRTPLARVGVGAVAVATVVVALVLALVIAPSEPPPSSAATVLGDTALVAASSPGLAPSAPNRYLFYEVTQTLLASAPEPVGVRQFPMVTIETIDTWVAPDGSGRQRIDVTGRHLLLPAEPRGMGRRRLAKLWAPARCHGHEVPDRYRPTRRWPTCPWTWGHVVVVVPRHEAVPDRTIGARKGHRAAFSGNRRTDNRVFDRRQPVADEFQSCSTKRGSSS